MVAGKIDDKLTAKQCQTDLLQSHCKILNTLLKQIKSFHFQKKKKCEFIYSSHQNFHGHKLIISVLPLQCRASVTQYSRCECAYGHKPTHVN